MDSLAAPRLFQIALARVRLRSADASADIETRVNALVQRVRIARVESLAKFLATLKELDATLHAQRVKLLVVDSVASLFLNVRSAALRVTERQAIVARD